MPTLEASLNAILCKDFPQKYPPEKF